MSDTLELTKKLQEIIERIDGLEHWIETVNSGADRRLDDLDNRLSTESREREYRDDELQSQIEDVKRDVSRLDRGW